MKPILKIIQLHKNHKTLLKKVRHNDRNAQQQLYTLFSPKMLSVCRYYINDLQYAEEVMLNGFFNVFTKINQYKDEGSFEGWMRRIMVREAISFLRQKQALVFEYDDHQNYVDEAIQIDVDIDAEAIQMYIDGLPEGYRLVFVMYAIEGYKHHEIAEMLKISVGTSKSQLFKARKLLQEKLAIKNKSNYGRK